MIALTNILCAFLTLVLHNLLLTNSYLTDDTEGVWYEIGDDHEEFSHHYDHFEQHIWFHA